MKKSAEKRFLSEPAFSKDEAGKVIVSSQFQPGNLSTLNVIRHLGYVQIDTISVVERSHHHIIWTRNEKYKLSEINFLMREKKILEYWSHAAAYLPMEDFRFTLPRKEIYKKGKSHWFVKEKRMMKYVLDRIKAEGPLMAKDFQQPKKASGWYEWKPAKKALEQLFMDGTLMIAERKNFQKVYDLAERVLPPEADTSFPEALEHARHMVLAAVRSNGIISKEEILYLKRKDIPVQKALDQLTEEKTIERCRIRGLEKIYYTGREKKNTKIPATCKILSPFDNLLIQRKRTKDIFGFDYSLECYLPEHKRKFGYFVLPVLMGSSFCGRLDLKAERKHKTLVIRNFREEKKLDDKALYELSAEIKNFGAFNGCTEVFIENGIGKRMRAILKENFQLIIA